MVSIRVNRSGYHSVNYNNSGRSLNFKKKKHQIFADWTDAQLRASVQSTRRIIKRIVHNQDFEDTSFLTLTFKENVVKKDVALYEFKKFIQRLNYFLYKTKKKQIKYLAVPEKQQRGSYHFHIILFDVPYIPKQQIQDLWGLGFVQINKVKDANHLVSYIVKYITKDFIREAGKCKKKILTSKGLEKGIIIRGLPDDEKIYATLQCLYSQQDCRLIFSKFYEDKISKNYTFKNLFEIYFSKNFYAIVKNELFKVKNFRYFIIQDLVSHKQKIVYEKQKSIDKDIEKFIKF